jgi:hypothetical protein
MGAGGLIGILVLIAEVILTLTGGYLSPSSASSPGMNRWVLRVAAYEVVRDAERRSGWRGLRMPGPVPVRP